MINTYTAGQAHNPNDAWLLSNWGAGQTLNMEWQADNVSKQADGTTVLTLDRTGISKPYAGGEIQSADADTFGTWEYIAKAPQMVDGAVFGMFLYQADYRDDWLEFDFEFVGKDTTEVQVTVHMEDPSGKHIAAGKVIDLWFDASQEFAKYTISVDHDSAEFFINGRQVAQFTARDMPDGQWDTGPMKSYVDLWSADSRYTGWTGTWTGQNLPLKGYVWDASTPGGPALTPYNGSGTPTPPTNPTPVPADPANLLINGSFEASEVPAGSWAAHQTIPGWTALSGSRIELWNAHGGMQARNGSDFVELDFAGATDGFYQDIRTTAGQNYTLSFDLAARPGVSLSTQGVEVLWNGQVVATVNPQASGTHGIWTTPTFTVKGTGGQDRLTFREVASQGGDGLGAMLDNVKLLAAGGAQPGTSLPPPASPIPTPTGSTLRGTEGNDTLNGTAGDDTVDGLGGSDLIRAGAGNDVARGGEGTDRIAMDLGNDLIDGGGTFWDELFVEGSTAVTIDLARTTAQVTGLGTDTILNIENVSGGSGHDQIFGDGRWNLLKGGVGNDLLDGRTGQDRLEGGAGRDEMRGGADGDRDVFIFASVGDSAVGSGRDVVSQFTRGVDDIDLGAIDANIHMAGNQAFSFGGATAQAYGVWSSVLDGNQVVRADVNGDRVADLEIRVDGWSSLTASDFVL
jgi:Ca2+-binding RTX toxin-like protein